MLLLRTEAHHVLHPSPVVPTAIEDNDLATSGEALHVALKEHLGLFTVRRRGQCGNSKHARAYAFGERPDRPSLSCRITSLEDNDDAKPFVFDPILQFAKLPLQAPKFLRVLLVTQLLVVLTERFLRHESPLSDTCV